MTGGCPSAPAVPSGPPRRSVRKSMRPPTPHFGSGLPVLASSEYTYSRMPAKIRSSRSAAPVSDTPVVSPGRSARVELPELLPGRCVHRKDFLRGRISVKNAVDDDRVRFQCARTVADVIGPGDLQLIDVARVDLFQRRIPHSTRVTGGDGPLDVRRRALRMDHRYHHDEISGESSPSLHSFISPFFATQSVASPSAGLHVESPTTQKVAIGFSTEPVAPGTAAGDAVTRKSQRLRVAASRPTASRSRLSKIGTPIAMSDKA